MRALELQMCLDEQAAEYEQEISRIKRKMFFRALFVAIIAFYVVWLPFLVLSSL